MSPDTITVLSTPSCQRCKTVARHLEARGVAFDYVDVTTPEGEAWRDEMVGRNLANVPQTVLGEEWIEGVDFDAINRLF